MLMSCCVSLTAVADRGRCCVDDREFHKCQECRAESQAAPAILTCNEARRQLGAVIIII